MKTSYFLNRISLVAVLCVFGLHLPAQGVDAKELKIAVVDMQKALITVKAGKKAQSRLKKQIDQKQKNIQKKEQKLKTDLDNFQKQSPVLSESKRQERTAALQKRIVEFQQEKAKTQFELQKKEKDMTGPIIEKLKKIVSQFSKKKGYDLVLEKNETGVLFSSNSVNDVTTEVIKTFDSKK